MGEIRRLFVTGGTGLIGRHLLPLLGSFEEVCCLARHPPSGGPENARWLRGDLLEVERHADLLSRCDRVLHLAAATSRVRPRELARVNVEGTRALLRALERAARPDLVHVSTIAVRFPGKERYPYAATKQRAEELVRASGLEHVVLRPTVVLGRDAPAWRAVRGLAGLPWIPLPGGGPARLQPIDVDDLARLVARILERPRLAGDTLELGGPEVVTFRELLARVRERLGSGPLRTVPLPLAPLIALLARLDPLVPGAAGRLHAFRHDSVASPAPGEACDEHARESLADVEAMLTSYLSGGAP